MAGPVEIRVSLEVDERALAELVASPSGTRLRVIDMRTGPHWCRVTGVRTDDGIEFEETAVELLAR